MYDLPMTGNRRRDFAPHIPPESAPPCAVSGCTEHGAYKAPISKDRLHDYQWYCLEHVREHNQQWDFFGGMSTAEIEQFMKEAVTGHRPTWSREATIKATNAKLYEKLEEFLSMTSQRRVNTPPTLPAKLRKALATLDLDYPYDNKTLKSQYRALVKKFHPDVNKGSKAFEEQFKQITASYNYLAEQLKKD